MIYKMHIYMVLLFYNIFYAVYFFICIFHCPVIRPFFFFFFIFLQKIYETHYHMVHEHEHVKSGSQVKKRILYYIFLREKP